MTLVVPDQGEKQMLDVLLGANATENLLLKLFTNMITPGEGDTPASYTEASGSGYAAITLTKGSGWTVTAGAGSGGAAQAVYTQQTFTFTGGPVTLYGYFVVGVTSGKLYWAEAFSPICNIPSGGGPVLITPKFELS